MKIAANYRVKEPISNFKLRVKIVQQRPLLAELENEGDTRDSNFLEQENRIFGWQEKVFSPFEANFYGDENNCLTEQQKIYHREIKESNVDGSQLYTYTQNDSYYFDNDLLTKSYKSKLARRNETALPALQNRKPFPERYNKTVMDDKPGETRIRTNHYLYMERSAMYVMVDLSRRDKTTITRSDEDSETVLCIVSYDQLHKILSVNPDFTNDRCNTITNSCGVKFTYSIEHVSKKQSSLELQKQQNESRREIKEQLIYKEAEIFHGLELPPPNTHTIFLKMDIMSAHDFSLNGLFISYYIHLPEYWTTSQNDRLFGRTQRCNVTNKLAHFGYATEISLNFPSINILDAKKVLPSWPRLLISVASFDSWTRYCTEGYASVALPVLPGSYEFNIPTWRPTGSIINSLRRFFTGGTYELEDITYCSIPIGHEGVTLNKSHLKVTQSGYVKINMNITHQTHSSIKNSDLFHFEKLSTVNLMTNIENIFEQFKAARERMIKIRNLNI